MTVKWHPKSGGFYRHNPKMRVPKIRVFHRHKPKMRVLDFRGFLICDPKICFVKLHSSAQGLTAGIFQFRALPKAALLEFPNVALCPGPRLWNFSRPRSAQGRALGISQGRTHSTMLLLSSQCSDGMAPCRTLPGMQRITYKDIIKNQSMSENLL